MSGHHSTLNSLNSSLVKHVPLSDTVVSGRPCVAKILCSFSMVYDVAVDGTTSTSNHLECASTRIRNCFPRNGPAWSICRRNQGWSGHFQGCKGDWGGAFWCCWHCKQFLTISSILFVSPGHQTMLLAIPFMWEMLGCPSCRSSRTPCCPFLGMMTLLPHNTHPLCTDSSSLRRLPHFFLLSISPSL